MNENKLIGEGNQELAPDAPPEYGALPSSSIASSSSSSSSPAAPRREGRWSNGERVRYVETEKKYVARPGFYELDVNTELRHFDSNSNWLRLLDRSFGAMTHALVQQNELLKQNFQQLIEWSQLPTTALSADTLFEKMHSLFSEKSTYIKVSEDLLQLICGRRADIIQRRRDCILSSVKDKYIKHDLSKIPPTNANLFNPQQLGTFLEKAGGTNKLFTAQKRSAEEPHQMSMRNRQGGPQAKRPRRSFRNAEPDYDPQPSTSSRAATFKDFKGKNQKNFDNRRPKQGDKKYPTTQNKSVNDSESVIFYAGRLKDYIQVWEALSAPNHILKLIRGYRIPFQVKPPLQNPNLLKRFQTSTSSSMSEQIITLKNQKVLIPVKLATPSFVSPMFLIKKSDSSNRPIFDLQNLNDYVSVVKFRLINVQRVPTFLQANDWVVKIDLTQAYFHLPIAQSHQRYLRVLYTPEATRRPELLQITWRPSTKKMYSGIWKKWHDWCLSHSFDHANPSSAQLAKYLAFLHLQQKLSYKTILVYKSAISTLVCSQAEKLSNDPLVHRILKAISLANVQAKPKTAHIWDPRVVIEWLTSNSPSVFSLLEVSRRTAIILLLASSRRVHDLTLLHIDADHFQDNGDNIIMHPVFGSKTDNYVHRQSSWKLKENQEKNVCPVRWLRKLIDVSSSRRHNSDLSELFISTLGKVRPASRTVIGGWIKTLLRDAGVEATPGSTRSASASLNWLENHKIEEIMEKGNWRVPNTFANFYSAEIISFQNNKNLSNSFEAV
ncbi:putative reverse transcriptase-7 [Operophtera brumata]|uniref:Putative reverse transcriptase-7 n=1 Tax=Operophtera brumata TaxID=104452 RepID=A0A0L7LVM0_OPEBR|nr:putative reverse transcriptase-7 [Operophtera brumata]